MQGSTFILLHYFYLGVCLAESVALLLPLPADEGDKDLGVLVEKVVATGVPCVVLLADTLVAVLAEHDDVVD